MLIIAILHVGRTVAERGHGTRQPAYNLRSPRGLLALGAGAWLARP